MSQDNLLKSLKKRRINLGVTQQQIAELSGVALRTIKQIENNNGNPTNETIRKIADVLGMDLKLEIRKIS